MGWEKIKDFVFEEKHIDIPHHIHLIVIDNDQEQTIILDIVYVTKLLNLPMR